MNSRRLLAAALVAGLGGCTLPGKFAPPTTAVAVAPQQPAVTVQHGKLLATDESSLPPGELVNRVRNALSTGQQARAGVGVLRHPEASLESLRSADCAAVGDAAVRAVATGYDRACVRDGRPGWDAVLADRQANPQRYADYDRKRAAAAEHLKAGRSVEALGVKLATAVPPNAPPLVSLDAAHLTACAAIGAGQPKAAAAVLTPLRASFANYPHQGAYLLLLLSEAERRCGRDAEAEACWDEAVALNGSLLNGPFPVVDPVLWDRCAFHRPAHTPWPGPVNDSLARVSGLPRPSGVVQAGHALAGAGGEPLVWACIGQVRLTRGEPELALAALKQAEAWTPDPAAQQALQLAQAEALIELGQLGPASAILTKLTSQAGPHVTQSRALLGAVLLRGKSAKQALPVLRQAVEEGGEWPGRAQAEANLGIASLVFGDEEGGLRWLHSAQKRFETAGEWAQLRQSLENEANYLEKVEKKDAARAVRQRLTTR